MEPSSLPSTRGWVAVALLTLGVLTRTTPARGADVQPAEPPAIQAQAEPDHAPNLWLTAAEVGFGLGAGTLWYVLDRRNVLDWDHPNIKARLNGDAWRYDSNDFAINQLGHPLSGAYFHAIARSNELGFWGSGLTSVTSSMLWEHVVEFNEKASINDVLMTPLGGIPIGEFAHKLGVHLAETQPRTSLGRIVAATLGPTVAINDAFNGRTRCAAPSARRCGYWHEFELGLEVARLKEPAGTTSVAERLTFAGTLVSLEGYRTAPQLTRWFHEGEISRLSLAAERGSDTFAGQLDAETLLAGLHHQRMSDATPRSEGVAFTGALALAYRLRGGRALGYDDRQGLLHLPGPAVDLFAEHHGLGTELRARAAYDFVSLSSLATPGWLSEHAAEPSFRTKTVLQREGYFFGWGPYAQLSLKAWAGPLWLAGSWTKGRYDSSEGLDRAQESLTDDTALRETLTEYDYRVGLAPTEWLRVSAYHRIHQRRSQVGERITRARSEELGVALNLSF
jgi:hypothetical protein